MDGDKIYVVRYVYGDPQGQGKEAPQMGVSGRFEHEDDALKGQEKCEAYFAQKDKDEGRTRQLKVWIETREAASLLETIPSTKQAVLKDPKLVGAA